MKKSKRIIQRNLSALRHLRDTTPDPYVSRFASAMETAVRWATEDTHWLPLVQLTTAEAETLKDDLAG